MRPYEARSASKQDFFCHIFVRYLLSVCYRTDLTEVFTEVFSAVVTSTRGFDEVSSSRAASTKILICQKELSARLCLANEAHHFPVCANALYSPTVAKPKRLPLLDLPG